MIAAARLPADRSAGPGVHIDSPQPDLRRASSHTNSKRIVPEARHEIFPTETLEKLPRRCVH
ncbi:hypothetical protein CBM2609_B110015 [Cupriavidus taiwanensis]|nr:hypothetical protein CBM2604_B120014 [Cupriavidus taiwanensis]SOZ30297.1 hypothetical protein CBM2609_B110015 [Cupriavidus taiwanensis]SOZ49566.1 hypothetical protein CBM2610_B90015 [Cupriavidus taiwanensis]SPA01616.1 hypothetical protein CBM2626_B120231 [Cupriavidus taiwanensis]